MPVQRTRTHAHRGYADDPPFKARRLLRQGHEPLIDTARAKLNAALLAGDPTLEVTFAWPVAQQVRSTYRAPNPDAGRA